MTTQKKKILFYCQHSLGMGHLVRSLALADSLSSDFQITLLNGGRLPKKLKIPSGIKIVNLPPLGFDDDGQLVSRDARRTVERAQKARQKIILERYRTLKPDVVLIELFPFGRNKFTNELLPLIEEAQKRSKIICSVRDILVNTRKDQLRHDKRAIKIAELFFNAILVHSDEAFARFEDSLQEDLKINIPVYYTGFVSPDPLPSSKTFKKNSNQKNILVSAGGGLVGEDLFQTAVKAHRILSSHLKVKTTIVGGPFVPKPVWRSLQKSAENDEHIHFKRFVPDLREQMRRADVSVSQCGYNTALDILSTKVPALVVPFGNSEGENEQTVRAKRLEENGLLRVCGNPTADELARKTEDTFDFQPKRLDLNIDGGKNSSRVILQILKKKSEKESWLDPIKVALEKDDKPIQIFFRDDDAGIGNSRLFRLLDLFAGRDFPLDIAVIPKKIAANAANGIAAMINAHPKLFAIHQHGFAHINHETMQRKCEFGLARNKDLQMKDIAKGKLILCDLFGDLSQPIFTPPWNRCTSETCEALTELGFKVLSREDEAKPLKSSGLVEIPISFNWFAKYKGISLSRVQVGKLLAHSINTRKRVGIMLHHAAMGKTELKFLSDLLELFSQFKRIEKHSIWSLYDQMQKRSVAHV